MAGAGMATLEAEIGELLGGSSSLQGQPDLRAAVQHGLPYEALVFLASALDVDDAAMADLLAISERTRQRRKRGALSPAESDRLARVARVVSHAQRVFGGRDTASQWLRRENAALGGQAPLFLLDTDLGAAEVGAVLVRIEHGVFA